MVLMWVYGRRGVSGVRGRGHHAWWRLIGERRRVGSHIHRVVAQHAEPVRRLLRRCPFCMHDALSRVHVSDLVGRLWVAGFFTRLRVTVRRRCRREPGWRVTPRRGCQRWGQARLVCSGDVMLGRDWSCRPSVVLMRAMPKSMTDVAIGLTMMLFCGLMSRMMSPVRTDALGTQEPIWCDLLAVECAKAITPVPGRSRRQVFHHLQ